MGQLASIGKLPSTVLRKQGSSKVQRQGRGGGKSIHFQRIDCCGMEAGGVCRLPGHTGRPDAWLQYHINPEVARSDQHCSRKEFQTTPLRSGPRAEPEMPASPLDAWLRVGLGVAPGTGRGWGAVLVDSPFKGTLCAASVVERGVMAAISFLGMTMFSSGVASHWPKARGDQPSPLVLSLTRQEGMVVTCSGPKTRGLESELLKCIV